MTSRCIWFLATLLIVGGCQTTGNTDAYQSIESVSFPPKVKCPQVVSEYGTWRTARGGTRAAVHNGIDIPANPGTPVYAVANGTVVEIQKNVQPNGMRVGMEVFIDHTPFDYDGSEPRLEEWFQSRYVHVKNNIPVTVGQKVKRGQVIAFVGPHHVINHLHFGVRDVGLGRIIDPMKIFDRKYIGQQNQTKLENVGYTDGEEVYPKGALIIWPLACKRKS